MQGATTRIHNDYITRFMKIKPIGKAVAVFGVVMLFTWVVMPTERASQFEESFRRLQSDPGIMCLDYERQSLNDPGAAKLHDTTKLKDDDIVKINYSAKNAYGAYVSANAVCSLRDGKIDPMSTENARTLDQLNKHIACLEAKLKSQENGAASTQVRFERCIEGLLPLK